MSRNNKITAFLSGLLSLHLMPTFPPSWSSFPIPTYALMSRFIVSVNSSHFGYIFFYKQLLNITQVWKLQLSSAALFSAYHQSLRRTTILLHRGTFSQPRAGSLLLYAFLLHIPSLCCKRRKLSEVRAGNRLKICCKPATVEALISS